MNTPDVTTAVGIIGQRTNAQAEAVVETLLEVLTPRSDVDVRIDTTTATALGVDTGASTDELAACDLAVSVGGDGTFLYTARTVGATPILGINLGEVGFLTAVDPADATEAVTNAIERYQRGELTVHDLPTLKVRGTDTDALPVAVNEVVVQARRRGASANVTFDLEVNGTHYATERADGVLVATPTGSTAYNLSEDGPLVHPRVGATVVTVMCPQTGTRPLVVDADATVTITANSTTEAATPTGHLVVDGRDRQEISLPTTVTIEQARTPARIAGPGVDFFEALEKLS